MIKQIEETTEYLINKGFKNLERFSLKTITKQYMDLYHKIVLK